MTDAAWYLFRDVVYGGDFLEAEILLDKNPSLRVLRNSIGETALHFLAVENDLRSVSWFHAHGFSLNEQNEFGTPVLFEVAQLGYRELFIWFLENGAETRTKNRQGNDLIAYLREHDKDEMASFAADAIPTNKL